MGVIDGGFSGLELGRVEKRGGTLPKNDVMGLWIGFDFAGDFVGDFAVALARAEEARCGSDF
jgi:hypothetical protein